jgi:hypothetical protein
MRRAPIELGFTSVTTSSPNLTVVLLLAAKDEHFVHIALVVQAAAGHAHLGGKQGPEPDRAAGNRRTDSSWHHYTRR